jgi:hypothetical protein
MADFQSSSLSHSISGNYVLFRVDARIKFQPHELNTHWFLDMRFVEDDRFADDKLGSSSRTFLASSLTQDVSFDIRIKKSKVDTEWGNEEVFARVEVKPLEAPLPFRMDTAKTNTVSVDV